MVDQVVNPFDDGPSGVEPPPSPPPEAAVEPATPPRPQSQADKVLAKFGGARSLQRALQRLDPAQHRDAASIYKWTYPRNKGGTGGLIPAHAMAAVMEAARIEGILLAPEDFYPGLMAVPVK